MKQTMKHCITTTIVLLFFATATARVFLITSDGKYEYCINDDNLTVTIVDYLGEGGVPDIPERIDGRLVTCLDYSAFQNAGFTGDLIIPSGVRVIEERAFQNNPGLTSVTIPPSVKLLTSSAFWQCPGVTDVYDLHIYPDIIDPPTFHEFLWYYTYNTYPDEECFAGPDSTRVHIMQGTLARHLNTQPISSHYIDLFIEIWRDINPESIVDDIPLPTDLPFTINSTGFNVVYSTTGWVVPEGITAQAITWDDITLTQRVGLSDLEIDDGNRFIHRGWDLNKPWIVDIISPKHHYEPGNTVPMGTAVLVYGVPGNYTANFDYNSNIESLLRDNLLHGRDFPSVTDYPSPDSTYYAGAFRFGLFRNNEATLGFMWDKLVEHPDSYEYMHPDDGGQYVAEAHEPWLTLTSNDGNAINDVNDVHFLLSFLKDIPVSISTTNVKWLSDDTYTDLLGHRYNTRPQSPGIYIYNGQKFILR